jgi:hypothetical protein
MSCEVVLVEFSEEIKVLPLAFARRSGGWGKVKNRTAFWAEWSPLKVGGEEAIRPITGSALWVRGTRKHNKPRKILIFTPEAISDPRANPWIAAKAITSIELVACGRVVH